jgi:RNA polymerase sigma-70 factor (ECF subfamily)
MRKSTTGGFIVCLSLGITRADEERGEETHLWRHVICRRTLHPFPTGAVYIVERMRVETSPTTEYELWSDLHGRLRSFVGRRIGDPDAADDVAQEVLLRLHRNLGSLRSDDRLDAFAYRTARNAIIDHYRARSTAKEAPAAPDHMTAHIDAGGAADENEGEGRRELARCLEPLVKRLPEPYREALMLTDLGELSQVEAARAVGLSIPGMKARVQRARAKVHERLADCCAVALDESQQIADIRRTGPCACTRD